MSFTARKSHSVSRICNFYLYFQFFLVLTNVPSSHAFLRTVAFRIVGPQFEDHHQLYSTNRKKTSPTPKRGSSIKRNDRKPQASSQGKPQTRPALTDYAANRNDFVNKMRLKDSIKCKHFDECPGCSVDKNIAAIDTINSARLYFSSQAVQKKRTDQSSAGDQDAYPIIIPSEVIHWRTQAKLAVAPKSSSWSKDGCAFGLYKKGTHQVLSISECAVHHPSINRAVHELVEATEKTRTSAYQEETREGGLRYVQFQVERLTRKICLTFVWNAASLKETQPALTRLVKQLKKQNPDLWHSMWVHCNPGAGNNIFSRNPKAWHRIDGPEFIREPLPVSDKGWLYFSPLTFRQGNLDGFDVLANNVARIVPGGSQVCELYAGIGVLGLTALAYHAEKDTSLKWIRCSDENPANLRCFKRSVSSLPVEMTGKSSTGRSNDEEEPGLTLKELANLMESGGYKQTSNEDSAQEKTSYMVASAADALLAGQALGAQVLIVDPPRKGLEDRVLDELCKPFNPKQPYVEKKMMLMMDDQYVNWTNDVQTLIYVSCGFDALARDCDRLLSSGGGWMLESARGYVLFPGSDHVETICVFQRK